MYHKYILQGRVYQMFKLSKKLLDAMKVKNESWVPAMEGPDLDVRYGCTAGCGGNPCSSRCKGSCKGSCTRSCKGSSR